MKQRKLKKWPIITLLFIILLSTGGFSLYKYIEYRNSNTFKLLELGYTKVEISKIEKKLKNVNKIIKMDYEDKLVKLLDEKYFIEKNLDQYLAYTKKNIKKSLTDVIAIVNVRADKEYYTNVTDTDTSKKELMLVNKYHKLLNTFAPEKIVTISSKYAYANNQISEDIYQYYKEMCNAAAEENIKLIANSGYRNYESQKKVYDSYVDSKGEEWANKFAAKPGYSEHQSGLALDIMAQGTNRNTFESSPAFTWLEKNAANYGFILRFVKDKEYLTGYDYEAWHYRYVGKDIAQKIKRENITFDEYYAFYLE